MKRAIRRHHRKRLKKNRRYHWGRDLINEPKILAVAVNTPCSCSCAGCGNPRRHSWENPLTIQERKALEDAKDQMEGELQGAQEDC